MKDFKDPIIMPIYSHVNFVMFYDIFSNMGFFDTDILVTSSKILMTFDESYKILYNSHMKSVVVSFMKYIMSIDTV